MQWEPEFYLDRYQTLLELAHRAIAEFPDQPESWKALAKLQLMQGDSRAATTFLHGAIARLPRSVELRVVLARSLLAEDAFDDALSKAHDALALDPEDPSAKILHFELLVRTGDWATAERLVADIAALSPHNEWLMSYYAHSLDPEELLSLCDAWLIERPAHTDALYFKALTLAKLNRANEAREVIALDHLIDISELAVPAAYPNAKTFREKLAEEIARNPTLVIDPRGKATRDGQQTRRLRQPGAVATEALIAQIKQAVDAYERRLAGSRHGFVRGRPVRARFDSWAIVYGGQGRQKAHRHPDGWLSGVFYVAAPRLGGENTYRGVLELGALDFTEHGIKPPWGTLDVEPVPGHLVLFPSYLPHATKSSGVEHARISVAFDVIPVT
jgi:tetratricopeptide (TPR) repeat protein